MFYCLTLNINWSGIAIATVLFTRTVIHSSFLISYCPQSQVHHACPNAPLTVHNDIRFDWVFNFEFLNTIKKHKVP